MRSGTASFDLGPEPLVLVPALVNGAGPFRFLLDTGSAHVAVAAHVADKAAVEADGGVLDGYSGVGGDYTFTTGRARSLVVAGCEVRDLTVSVTDLGGLAQTVGAAVDGILGFPFLRNFRLTIDFVGSAISLEDEAGPERAGAVEFRLREGYAPVVTLPTYVGDAGPLRFVLDSGSSIMGVAERTARAMGLQLRQELRPGYGDPAEFPHWWTDLERIAVGGAAVEGLEAIVYDMSRFEQAIGPPLDGIIGHPFLVRHGCVAIDYLAGTVSIGSQRD